MGARPRLLVVSPLEAGPAMAGPAIRAYELAKALQPHADVTFAAVDSGAAPPEGVDFVGYEHRDPRALRKPIARADAIFAQPPQATIAAWMRRSGARLIFDLWVPESLEGLEIHSEAPGFMDRAALTFTLDRLLESLHFGHHFVCAGARQRDLWLGAMLGERLIGPERYARDPTFAETIDTVPYGIPSEPPRATTPGPRQTVSGLGEDDELVLWNGGIWAWFDAPTAIHAMELLAERRPRAKLVFMGGSTATAAKRAAAEAHDVAQRLGVAGRSVIFHDEWVSYEERPAWLLQADCIVSAHRHHLESHFAYRTRMLDCLWARLPAVCSRGDELAEEFERLGLGATAPPGDAGALAGALDAVLTRGRDAYGDAFDRAAPPFRWTAVAEPLVRYVTATDLPPRLGDGTRRRAGAALRSAAYRAARRVQAAAKVRRV